MQRKMCQDWATFLWLVQPFSAVLFSFTAFDDHKTSLNAGPEGNYSHARKMENHAKSLDFLVLNEFIPLDPFLKAHFLVPKAFSRKSSTSLTSKESKSSFSAWLSLSCVCVPFFNIVAALRNESFPEL